MFFALGRLQMLLSYDYVVIGRVQKAQSRLYSSFQSGELAL